MTKTVLIRRPMVRGNTSQMVRASVLSEQGDTMRVVLEGQSKPVTVRASEVVATPGVNGRIMHSSLPDSPNSLIRILEKRGF